MNHEFTNDNNLNTRPDASEGLRAQVFMPGDRQALNIGDNLSPRELLENNERLIAEVQAQAMRIATAACKTLAGMPEQHQRDFFDGISCFTDKNDVVYNSMRDAWKTTV